MQTVYLYRGIGRRAMGVKNQKEMLCYVVVYGEEMNWRYVGSQQS